MSYGKSAYGGWAVAAGLVALLVAGCTRVGFDDWGRHDQGVGGRDLGSAESPPGSVHDALSPDTRSPDAGSDSDPDLTYDVSADVSAVDTVPDAEPPELKWTQMVSFSTADLYGVWGTGPEDVFAVGSGGAILHYDGEEWSVQDSGVTVRLYAVWGSSSSNVFAVGGGGSILRYDGSRVVARSVWNDVYAGINMGKCSGRHLRC